MVEITLHLQTREGSRQIPLTAEQLKIGRGNEADVRLDDDGLAPWQATVCRDGERIWLVNEISANQAQVNHREVPPGGVVLTDGDEIRLGHHSRLWVSIERQAGLTPKTKPAAASASRPLLLAAVLTAMIVIVVAAYSSRREAVFTPMPSSSPTATVAITPTPFPSPDSTPVPPQDNTYLGMAEADRLSYVTKKAQAISRQMSSNQRRFSFTPEAIEKINYYVGGYARRLKRSARGQITGGNCQSGKSIARQTDLWGDDLQSLYWRARCYAPLINKAFHKAKVPEVVGLYIVMVETEFNNPVSNNQAGAMGMFQFLASTAEDFGLKSEDRCEVLKMVDAAAAYMSRQMKIFGTDQLSMSLAVAGYNRGNASLIRDLKTVQKEKQSERSFWELMLNEKKFDKFFEENVKYVPKFFAAAIIGENPPDFGLTIPSLSTIREELALPPQGLHCHRSEK